VVFQGEVKIALFRPLIMRLVRLMGNSTKLAMDFKLKKYMQMLALWKTFATEL